MSVTSGFYNSHNGDRRYNAEQMAALFDGIINDGVFANVGEAFAVKSNGGNNITVGVGRAWLNSSWIYNDALLPLMASESDILLDRYDAVVLEINRSENVRTGSIKIVEGTPASNPAYPVMINTAEVHQYPLCYIYRKAESTEITQANITNKVGTSSLPYVTGILEVLDIDNIVARWEALWTEWFANEKSEFDEWADNEQTEFEEWSANEKNKFDTWFEDLKAALGDDVATDLTNRILALETGTKPAGKATNDGDGNEISKTYSKNNHKHTKSEISDFPSTMPPSSHTHTKSEISDFPSTMPPSSHKHTKSEISDFPSTMPPSSHNQSASTITAGTLGGQVIANSTAEKTLGTSQVRNIHAGTSALYPGASTLATGRIYIMYEE